MGNFNHHTVTHHPFVSLLSCILFTKSQIIEVQNQYDALKFPVACPDGFGIPLTPQAVLNVGYPNVEIHRGHLYNKLDVSIMPTISVSPVTATTKNFKPPSVFSLIMSDANTLGKPEAQGSFRHFLANDVTFDVPSQNNSFEADVNEESGTLVTPHVAPDPLPNTGERRYAWLLFDQPPGFKAPANLSTNPGPGYWGLKSYVTTTGLGDLVAANFFSIQNNNGTSNSEAASASAMVATNTSTTFQSPQEFAAALVAKQNLAQGQHPNLTNLIKGLIYKVGIPCISFWLIQ